MNKIFKITSLALSAAAVLTLTACGGDGKTEKNDITEASEAVNAIAETQLVELPEISLDNKDETVTFADGSAAGGVIMLGGNKNKAEKNDTQNGNPAKQDEVTAAASKTNGNVAAKPGEKTTVKANEKTTAKTNEKNTAKQNMTSKVENTTAKTGENVTSKVEPTTKIESTTAKVNESRPQSDVSPEQQTGWGGLTWG